MSDRFELILRLSVICLLYDPLLIKGHRMVPLNYQQLSVLNIMPTKIISASSRANDLHFLIGSVGPLDPQLVVQVV